MSCPHCGSQNVYSKYGWLPLVLIEQEEYRCKSCGRAHKMTLAQLATELEERAAAVRKLVEEANNAD